MPEYQTEQALAPAATYDVAVIGAGPAGCAAALAARQAGAARVLLADLAAGPGGAIGAMGMRYNLPTETTLAQAGIDQYYQTTLIRIASDRSLALLGAHGLLRVAARAVVLATGGREQTRGGLAIPGTRPSGVLTAGAALRLLADTGRAPGRRVVLAGAGRWAGVAARLLADAGATIVAQPAGVAEVLGWPRVSGVVLADGQRVACDLLALATPLLPWLPPALAGAAGMPGVVLAGGAAQPELSADQAAEHALQVLDARFWL